jgi:diguanylate cyclase (GGDEF)-like protein
MTARPDRFVAHARIQAGTAIVVAGDPGDRAPAGLGPAARLLEYAGELCRHSRREAMDAVLIDAVMATLAEVCPGASCTVRPMPLCAAKPDWPEMRANGVYPLFAENQGEATLCLYIHAATAVPESVQSLLRSLLRVYHAHAEVLRWGMTDSLTGLLNRTAFDAMMPDWLQSDRRRSRQRRERSPDRVDWLGVLDLDHFKSINDRHGHAAGDAALRVLAGLLRSLFRARDTVFRIGGEEFAVTLRDATAEEAREAYERLRLSFAELDLGTGCRTTLSLGVGHLSADDDPAHLLHRVDQALYRAKHAGRNRVVFA